LQGSGGKIEQKGPLGKHKGTWGDNIKVILKIEGGRK
jgi:hypothetical protein